MIDYKVSKIVKNDLLNVKTTIETYMLLSNERELQRCNI
jgi:hypothetical protein